MSVANLGGALNVFHVIQYEKATALIKTNSNPLLKKKNNGDTSFGKYQKYL